MDKLIILGWFIEQTERGFVATKEGETVVLEALDADGLMELIKLREVRHV